MHQPKLQQAFNLEPMQIDRSFALKLLLRRGGELKCVSSSGEANRRDLHRASLLWLSQNLTRIKARGLLGEPQADPKSDAISRTGRSTTRSKHFETSSRTQNISLSFEREKTLQTSRSLELRYHIHSTTRRSRLSCCNNRLVQSPCPCPSTIEQSRDGVLSRSARFCFEYLWASRDIQHGSRGTVHIKRVYRCDTEKRYSLQYGRKGKSARQYFCRASLEVSKI